MLSSELSEQEKKVIEIMRETAYGDVVVYMKDYKAVRMEVKESILL